MAGIAIVVFIGGSFGQIGAIALGAIAGLWLCRNELSKPTGHLRFPVSRRNGAVALFLFAALFVIPPLLVMTTGHQAVALFDAFTIPALWYSEEDMSCSPCCKLRW